MILFPTAGLSLWLAFAAGFHRASAADWYVDDSNTSGTENGSTQFPYRNLQAAIEAAASGDTIRVAVGTYGAIHSMGKGLSLLGGYRGAPAHRYAQGEGGDFNHRFPPPSRTWILGDGTETDGVTWTRFNEDPYEALLDNFGIRGFRKGVVCDTAVSWPHPDHVTIRNNLIEWNGSHGSVSQGGGVIVTGENSAVLNNLIRHNQGGRGAGVLRVGSAEGLLRIEGNVIERNTCYDDHGAGLMIFGEVYLTRNIIAHNRIDLSYGWGGGLLMHTVGTLYSEANIVHHNHAPSYGGGVFVDEGARAVLRNDLIHDNTTETGQGGGVAVDDGTPGPSEIHMTQCTVVFNNRSATDIGLGGNGLFLDNQGQGTAIHAENCIFWGNQDDFQVRDSGAVLTLVHCLSEEEFVGTGSVHADPLFLNSQGDFRLGQLSPAIGAGTLDPWMADAQDLAGRPRVISMRIDLGAYQWSDPEPQRRNLIQPRLFPFEASAELVIGSDAVAGVLQHLEFSLDLDSWVPWGFICPAPPGGLTWHLMPIPDAHPHLFPVQFFARPIP